MHTNTRAYIGTYPSWTDPFTFLHESKHRRPSRTRIHMMKVCVPFSILFYNVMSPPYARIVETTYLDN